jgi:hypothetical protein
MIPHERYNAGKGNISPSDLCIVCAMRVEFYLMADPVHSHDKGQGKLAPAHAMEAYSGPDV